tara:strand:+ start:6151 stop:8781 length:2631 start_codon:yes stop_codon:yes gene_type:complete
MSNFSINAVKRRVVLSGSAGTGPYAFTFEILDQNDISVFKDTTKLTLTADYTVSINANGTGSVTLGVAATSSNNITIIGARDIERTTDFVTAGDLKASSLNEQLDALTIFDQQINERVDRAVISPVDDPQDIDMTLPSKSARVGKYLAFNSTTGQPEAGPSTSDVNTLASVTSDIATLADIQDGTTATNAITTVSGISNNVATVAGISGNVTTVAGMQSDVAAVVADATDIGTVASNITNVNSVAAKASLITNDFVSDLNTLAVTDVINDINTLATSDIVSDLNTLATSDIVSDLNTLATTDIINDINTLATNDIVTDLNLLATSDFVSDLNTMATAQNVSDLNDVAGAVANINTLASSTNLSGINSFAERYRIGSSNPTSSLDAGDLFFNTTDNELKVYNGSAWVAATSAVNGTSVRQTYTVGSASGGYDGSTTVFPIAYDVGFVDVYLNGVRLAGADFTATNGTSVTLGSAAATGDTVDMVAFGIFNVASISAAALTSGTIPDARFPATLPAVSGANLTGINTDLAADSTPQLGGNLDVQTHSIVSTSNQDITLSPDGTGNVVMNTDNLQIIESDDGNSQAPNLDLRRISSSPADNDVLGAVRFYGKDSAGNDELYGKISVEAEDVTNTVESSTMHFEAQPDCRMQLYRPNISNKFLYFLDEQILHWTAHRGTNFFCRLSWETPTQNNFVFLPNVQSGTLSHVALSTTTITSPTAFISLDNLPDEFDTFQILINAHPVNDGVSFRSRMLDTSGNVILATNSYGYYRGTDGGDSSSDNATFIQHTGNSIGSSNYEGVVANLTLQGRNFTTSSVEVAPPVIHGTIVGHYNTSVASGGFTYGMLNDNNIQSIRGLYFYFSSGNIARATVQVFGIQNT